jgi:hypothetical protein
MAHVQSEMFSFSYTFSFTILASMTVNVHVYENVNALPPATLRNLSYPLVTFSNLF